MANAMKGKKYKICIRCGKKRAYGPWKALRPNHGICSSCLDLSDTNVEELIEGWKKKKT